MDPNATRQRILDTFDHLIDAVHPDGPPPDREVIGELIDAFLDLDRWLSNGGFLPERWGSARNITKRTASLPTVDFTRYGPVAADNAAHVVSVGSDDTCEVRVLTPSGGYVAVGDWPERYAVETAEELNRTIAAWVRLGAGE